MVQASTPPATPDLLPDRAPGGRTLASPLGHTLGRGSACAHGASARLIAGVASHGAPDA